MIDALLQMEIIELDSKIMHITIAPGSFMYSRICVVVTALTMIDRQPKRSATVWLIMSIFEETRRDCFAWRRTNKTKQLKRTPKVQRVSRTILIHDTIRLVLEPREATIVVGAVISALVILYNEEVRRCCCCCWWWRWWWRSYQAVFDEDAVSPDDAVMASSLGHRATSEPPRRSISLPESESHTCSSNVSMSISSQAKISPSLAGCWVKAPHCHVVSQSNY